MIALYIIISIAALITLLVFSSVRISIIYDGQLKLYIGYLFLKFKVLPRDTKKVDLRQKKRKKRPESADKKKDAAASISEIIDIVKCVLKTLGPVLKAVRIRPLMFNISVTNEDAATTAIKAGALHAVVWPFVGWLANNVKVRGQSISIAPNYDGESNVYFKTCIRIRLNHIIAAGFNIILGILKIKSTKDGAQK